MELISHQYSLLQNVKHQYSLSYNIHELFKKYQTLLVIKKILSIQKPKIKPEINIDTSYSYIIGDLNIEYHEHLQKYGLQHRHAKTLGDFLENFEKKLNLLNLLLINQELYDLELIDFLIPITI